MRPAPSGVAEVSCLPRFLPVSPTGQGLRFMRPRQVPGRADEHLPKAHREPAAVGALPDRLSLGLRHSPVHGEGTGVQTKPMLHPRSQSGRTTGLGLGRR